MGMKIEDAISRYGIEGLCNQSVEQLESQLFQAKEYSEFNQHSVLLDYNGLAYAAYLLRNYRDVFFKIIQKVFENDSKQLPEDGKLTPALYLVAAFQDSQSLAFLLRNATVVVDKLKVFLAYKNNSGYYGIHLLITKHVELVVEVIETITADMPAAEFSRTFLDELLAASDKEGNNVLHLLADRLNPEQLAKIIKILFKKMTIASLTSLLNKQNNQGVTPFHILCSRDVLAGLNEEILNKIGLNNVKALLLVRDKFNGTPLHQSSIKQPEAVNNLLVAAISEKDSLIYMHSLIPDEDNRTIVHLAAVYQSEAILLKMIGSISPANLRVLWAKQVRKEDGFVCTLFYQILKYKGFECLKKVLTILCEKLEAFDIESPFVLQAKNATGLMEKIDQLPNKKCVAIHRLMPNKVAISAIKGTVNSIRIHGIANQFVINQETGDTLVHTAIVNNSLALLIELLRQKADFNQPNAAGFTPWTLALSQPTINLNILLILLIGNARAGNADSKAANIQGDELADIAIDNNWPVEIINILINSGLQLKHVIDQLYVKLLNRACNLDVTAKGITVLPYAVPEKIKSQFALLLLAHGANINVQNQKKDTMVHIAIRDGWDENEILELLKYKPTLSLENNSAETPLKLLMSIKNLANHSVLSSLFGSNIPVLPFSKKIAIAMIEKGADVNTKNPQGQTLVHLAVLTEDDDLLAKLKDLHANFKECDHAKKSPWEYIKPSTPFKVILALLEGGAAPDNKLFKYNGLTPIHQLLLDTKQSTEEFVSNLKSLMKAGLSIHAKDSGEKSPLAMLLNMGYLGEKKPKFKLEFAVKLIEEGADPNTKDINGNTIFHLLAAYDKEAYDYLIQKFSKFDTSQTNNAGNTPLQILLGQVNIAASSTQLKKANQG